ncbi:hypothetical protein EDB87DRAFT_1630436, partial [Lactarius vividus]
MSRRGENSAENVCGGVASGSSDLHPRPGSNKKPRLLPQFNGTSTTPPRSRVPRPQHPDFRSDFASPGANQRNIPSDPPRRRVRIQPGPVVPLEALVPGGHTRPIRQIDPPRPSAVEAAPVNDENVSTAAPVSVLSPPPLHQPVTHSSKSTKVIEPPKIPNAHPRPSTPPRSLTTPNPISFLSIPLRPSKPVSSTHVARATDVLTNSGRAELLGLTLAQDGATPMENAVRRGLEVTPRKAGAGKEIRYTRGGLAERASQVIGRKTTSLSLWRKSTPSLESASMLVEIEQVLRSPKPPAQRGGLQATLICLARCRPSGEDDRSILVLLSVPPHDAKNVPIATIKGGSRVALWEPLQEVEMGSSVVYLCSRFVMF